MPFIILLLCLFLSPPAFAHGGGHSPSAAKGDGEGISSGAMIKSPTASTLGRNRLGAGFAFNYLRYNSFPARYAHQLHHRGHDIHGKNHEEYYNTDIAYGILDDVDLYLTTPIVSKNSIEVHEHATLGKRESATGFGDMQLTSKYRFWKKHVEAAAIAGIKFPTGRTNDKRVSGKKFEAEQQPGTGSWDGEFGLVLSRNFKQRFSTATSFLYNLKTEGAQDFKAGDVFRYNIGASYALRKLGSFPNLSIICELNHEWALKDRSRTHAPVFDSGGTSIFVTPGLEAAFNRHVSVFWGMPVPIYQNLGGEHEELKFEILAGINVTA